MRLGLFGGSFDPVHNGHLIVVRAAADALSLDHVRFVPAGEQPFKAGRHGAHAPDRLAMLVAALAGEPGFSVDDREIHRPGPSYTIDTVREIRAECPNDELFLLVGADAAVELPAWRDAEPLAEMVTVVALTRPGVSVPNVSSLIDRVVAVPAIDISARTVRARLRGGDTIDDLVPPAVARCIAERGLYLQGD